MEGVQVGGPGVSLMLFQGFPARQGPQYHHGPPQRLILCSTLDIHAVFLSCE